MHLEFNENGVLEPKDYQLTIEQLKQSLLVQGPTYDQPWNKAWRKLLVDNLEIMLNQLYTVGIEEIFIDGSFVEDKASPSDIDGYFVVDPFDLERITEALNRLEPDHIWTWSERIPDHNSSKLQLPMWHKYHIELYPHVGQGCGILDEYGYEQMFPAAFRKTRDTFLPKGIIQIVKGGRLL